PGSKGRRCPSSVARRVGLAVAEEARRAFACFARYLAGPRLFDRVRAELCRHHRLDLELLLGGESEELVGGLLRLQRAFGGLASRDDRGERLGVVAHIVYDAVLNAHRLAERRHGAVELIAGASGTLVAGENPVEAA